jgi:hypothetical protein
VKEKTERTPRRAGLHRTLKAPGGKRQKVKPTM